MRVEPLDVGGGLGQLAEDDLIGEVRRMPAQLAEQVPGMPLLDAFPVALWEPVGLRGEDLDRMQASRCPAGIGQGRGSHEHPCRVGEEPAGPQVRAHPDHVLGPAGHPSRHRAARAIGRGERGGGGGAVVGGEPGHAYVVGVDAVVELLRPGAGRRHVPQVHGMDGGQHGGAGPVLLPALGLHPDAAPVGQQQPGDPAAAQHRAAVVGQVAGQGRGEPP